MIRRTSHILRHDASRVIAKPYLPGEEIAAGDAGTRAGLLMARILAIPEAEVAAVLEQAAASIRTRHKRFEELLERHFALVAHHVGDAALSRERRLLIGAYFTNEYSVEGGRAVQPVARARARSGRPGRRRATVRDEPARGRRGPHLVDRVSDRRDRRRRAR